MERTVQFEICLSKEELEQIERLAFDENRLKCAIQREYLTCMQSRTRSFELMASFKKIWKE